MVEATLEKPTVRITPYLSKEAKIDITTWRNQGKAAFHRVIEQKPDAECKNCGDWRQIVVSFCSKGPSMQPVTPHKPSTYFSGNGTVGKGWYLIENTVTYDCPNCSGRR